jgi:hypothetical protein
LADLAERSSLERIGNKGGSGLNGCNRHLPSLEGSHVRIAIVFIRDDGVEHLFDVPISNDAPSFSKEMALAISEAAKFLGVTPKEVYMAVNCCLFTWTDNLRKTLRLTTWGT